MTTWPWVRAQSISSGAGSKASVENCETTEPAGPGIASVYQAIRLSSGSACITTPLGRPVEPEVYSVYTGWSTLSGRSRSASVRSLSADSASSAAHFGPSSTTGSVPGGSRRASASVVTTAAGSASSSRKRMRSSG